MRVINRLLFTVALVAIAFAITQHHVKVTAVTNVDEYSGNVWRYQIDRDGKIHGWLTRRDGQGRLVEKSEYIHGLVVWRQCYNTEGEPIQEQVEGPDYKLCDVYP